MQKKKRILCLFDFLAHTGFGTVSKNIVDELCRRFGDQIELVVVGINFFGEEGVQYNDQTFVLSALKASPPGFPDEFGRMTMMKILKEDPEGYDAVFIIQDLGIVLSPVPVLKNIIREKRAENKKQPKFIFYHPVDCKLLQVLTDNLEFFDVPVTFTEFARKEILRFKPELATKLKVIPHGISGKEFDYLPREVTTAFRKEYFGDNADKFIISAINRNQPRKDYPTTIFSFIEARKNWKQEHPKPFLYMHCNPKDPLGHDLRLIMEQTELVEDEDYMFPPKHMENHGATIETLCKIYNASDLFVTTNLGEGWGLCLSGSSEIIICGGVKAIKDVVCGDKVFSNNGIYNEVLATTKRIVGEFYKISPLYTMPVEVTPEHPFYVLRDNEELWVNVKDLLLTDKLAIRKPIGTNAIPEELDLLDLIPDKTGIEFNDEYVWYKFGWSPKAKQWSYSTIVEKYGTTKKVAENALKFLSGQIPDTKSQQVKELAKKLSEDKYEAPEPLKIKRRFKITDDLLWIFGYFLAEGSANIHDARIEFSLNSKAAKDAHKICAVLDKAFGISCLVHKKRKSLIRVRVSSMVLCRVFANLFGIGAYNKHIPSLFSNCELSLMPLALGYILGDGCIRPTRNHISYTTASPSLAYQIRNILLANGIFVGVKKTRKRANANYDSYNCIIAAASLNNFCTKANHNFYAEFSRNSSKRLLPQSKYTETDTHFFIPITNIEKLNDKLDVYDLSVNKEHSFTANGIICHNTVHEAMACKLPVIVPYHTSMMELSGDGTRCYTVENLYPYCNTIDNIIRQQTDLYEMADVILEAVEKRINGTDLEMIERAYKYAHSLDWKLVCKRWIEIFKNLLSLK